MPCIFIIQIMHTTYLALGANLGDKQKMMAQAIEEIGACIGSVTACSSFIETLPWGFESCHTFLNAAVCVSTSMTPEELLEATQDIERRMGRKVKSADGIYHDRTIDIDILLYDDIILSEPRLVIPHPMMHLRRFVLEPLAEIAPHTVIPGTGKTVGELLSVVR
ncbi:MAG: 2-amino-4-hydroxy-6-hydroxymethyldihydropteridine diphosphokinase [Bacteroides sp.]|nr:2-amino-4-hydroxy-6-hydroxymethyldihydropteridine diphosphokinase [Roseburia sp.]MCM1346748.1 2-amino-4-hydroxy-6-hydroxymethyldihydropteridine diphosphokinase [Bacteroides sp.]MCM1421315.1 2-amino-4-hydroxy-6-hydroxymethyldihydropteridine diphosphokinase [Bacteroides sp.]